LSGDEQSTDTSGAARLLDRHGEALLDLAARSIEHGLDRGTPLQPDPADYDEELSAPGACFVTLHSDGELRGCIGSPEPHRPLVLDVALNAYATAFRDPRFPLLQRGELPHLDLELSLLSPQRPIDFDDEADLLRQLRPGVDGLVIAAGPRRALFLPSVWAQLPDPVRFLAHLKAKAGLDPRRPAPGLRAWRFHAEEVSATAAALGWS
jgi:AmmeMemoRadiSam system protein A